MEATTSIGKKFKEFSKKIKELGYLNLRDFEQRASSEEKAKLKSTWKK